MFQFDKVLFSAGAVGLLRGRRMRRIAVLLVAITAVAAGAAYLARASGQEGGESASVFVDKIPAGYRDWMVISVAHEEGNLNSLGAILGNEVAIKAYRKGKLPFPDGTIIAALHWRHEPSEENNKIFGLLVAGKAGLEQRRVAKLVAVASVKMTETPATGRGVLF